MLMAVHFIFRCMKISGSLEETKTIKNTIINEIQKQYENDNKTIRRINSETGD